MNEKICGFCGREPATTVDHIPPKGIFNKPLPSDLITVPACSKCNQGTSPQDEEFKTILSLMMGVETTDTKRFWDEGALRTFNHNRRLKHEMTRSMMDVVIPDDAAMASLKVTVGLLDAEVHRKTIEKITRGLYFHHFNSVVDVNCPMNVEVWANLDWVDDKIARVLTKRQIGDGVFRYAFVIEPDRPSESWWLYSFYGRHYVSCRTGWMPNTT